MTQRANNTFQNSRARRALRNWLCELNPNYFVTTNFNRDTTFEGARHCLRHWHGCVDRKLLGKNWCKKPNVARTFFIGFAEHPDSNLNYHLLLRVPDSEKHQTFEKIAADYWTRIVASGSLDLQKLNTDHELRIKSRYATKDLWLDELLEQFVISSEFNGRQ